MHFDHTLISRYFPDLTEEQLKRYKELGSLYAAWNAKINLISRKDFENLYLHHILHSLGIAKAIRFSPGSEVLDFGTGGGFPGIPLAIMFPQANFHLVDSIWKKVNVVDSIKTSLSLQNVKTEVARVEDIDGLYDFAVGRAVTGIGTIERWIEKKILTTNKNALDNGLIYFRGANEPEVERPGLKTFALKDYFSEDFFETKLIIHLPIFFSLSQKNPN